MAKSTNPNYKGKGHAKRVSHGSYRAKRHPHSPRLASKAKK